MAEQYEKHYGIDAIETLSFKEGVRRRIGMYLGSADMQGVYQAFQEIISNSIDEYYMGYGNHIKVFLENGVITVEDEGRGIPFGTKEDGTNVMESIFSTAHTGGKFSEKTYQAVAGLNGIGAKATCLSAKRFHAISYREGKQAEISFEEGNKIFYEENVNKTKKKNGTIISFVPDETVFKDEPVKISFKHMCDMCKNLSFLTKGLRFTLTNIVNGKENVVEYCAENGLLDLINEQVKKPVSAPIYINKKIDNTEIEIAMQWTQEDSKEYCFTNGLLNIEGGTSVTGLKTSLTRNLNKTLGTDFSGEIIRSGLIFAISCKVPNPSFANQVKSKVNNPELRSYSDQVCAEAIKTITKKELEIIKKYLEKEEKAANAAKKARETVRKTPMQKGGLKTLLAGKLADCSEKDRSKCELILCEGLSAMGTIKAARDPKTQAVLPLRGKVLNTAKTELSKCLQNQEILDMISSIGVGYKDNIDLSKRRYDKIIIATDADIDGAHIRILLLTFFLHFMPELIEEGYVYAALPPLYVISYKNEIYYASDDNELNKFMEEHPSGEKNVTYLKGLGEMSAEAFSDTVLNPNKRQLKRICLDDAADAHKWFEALMGKDVEPRKEFLVNFGHMANIDN